VVFIIMGNALINPITAANKANHHTGAFTGK